MLCGNVEKVRLSHCRKEFRCVQQATLHQVSYMQITKQEWRIANLLAKGLVR